IPFALNVPGNSGHEDPRSITSLVGFLDETDRSRTQSRLASIVSSSDDAIIGKTLEGVITSWNSVATNIFGYEPFEIIGQPITRLIPSQLHDEEIQILARVRSGERIKNYETVRISKDGRALNPHGRNYGNAGAASLMLKQANGKAQRCYKRALVAAQK